MAVRLSNTGTAKTQKKPSFLTTIPNLDLILVFSSQLTKKIRLNLSSLTKS